MSIHNRVTAALGALVSILVLAYPAQAQDNKYTMAMTWSFEASHLGYLAAQDLGKFKEAGVDVEVVRGHGATDTIRRLVTGDIEFGIIDATVLMKAMAQDPDARMVMVANTLQKSPYNVLYIKDRSISAVEDLAAAKFGDTGGSVAQLYPTFLKFALEGTGKPIDQYESVQLDPAVRIPALFRGDVDVVASVIFEFPNVNFRAKEASVELATFNYADYGFDPYTYGVVVRPDFAKDNPDVVKAAVRAVLEGWKWTCENPEKAAELLSNHQKDVPMETMQPQVILALDHVGSADTAKHGLGYMNPERWESTYRLGLQGWSLEESAVPPLNELYDTSFMPDEAVMAECG
jgi:NitT/TauT family transport system substrate-binding protein